MRSIPRSDTAGVDPPRPAEHPLPWRNTPSEGDNHVTDADGGRVYDGPDGAEMFRIYAAALDGPAPRGPRRRTGLAAWFDRLLHGRPDDGRRR